MTIDDKADAPYRPATMLVQGNAQYISEEDPITRFCRRLDGEGIYGNNTIVRNKDPLDEYRRNLGREEFLAWVRAGNRR